MPTARQLTDLHYTYADYLKFPEDERWEIIDGVAYNMSPSASTTHQDLSGEIFAQLRGPLCGRSCNVFMAPTDVRFEHGETSDKIAQTDLLVACDKGKIRLQGIIGARDCIVEILSSGKAGKDSIVKRDLYERQGVREYWLVHPVDRIVTVYRLNTQSKYATADVRELNGTLQLCAVRDLEIEWDLWEPLFPSE